MTIYVDKHTHNCCVTCGCAYKETECPVVSGDEGDGRRCSLCQKKEVWTLEEELEVVQNELADLKDQLRLTEVTLQERTVENGELLKKISAISHLWKVEPVLFKACVTSVVRDFLLVDCIDSKGLVSVILVSLGSNNKVKAVKALMNSGEIFNEKIGVLSAKKRVEAGGVLFENIPSEKAKRVIEIFNETCTDVVLKST